MTMVEHVRCEHCGVGLDLPAGKSPTVTFVARGGEPNVRILTVDGSEVHRCHPTASADPRADRTAAAT